MRGEYPHQRLALLGGRLLERLDDQKGNLAFGDVVAVRFSELFPVFPAGGDVENIVLYLESDADGFGKFAENLYLA